ncbi:ParA family protein [Aldersonia kunmingensis]|uniref:ParA family protein n=1 Tax=Aldersonia kunmingensis TaxID=408066 RepID=UPI00082CC512|nr:AAA family ATPase [Aldersonia kunmingensis]
MTRAIATINLKGGVGKTTTTAAVGEFLAAEFGQRVLLIDLDPQTNLTTMMIGEHRWQQLNDVGLTLGALFLEAVDPRGQYFDIDKAIQIDASPVNAVRGVDLLASSLDLIEIQEGLTYRQYRDPYATWPVELLLNVVSPVLPRYDYVLIDCPPNLGMLTLNGLRLAQGYIVPTIPDILSTYGIPQLQSRVASFAHRTGHGIKELGLVITKYRAASSLHRAVIEQLQRDERIANVIPAWVPEANQIAAAAECVDHRTLRGKYGAGEQFEELRNLTEDILLTSRVLL